MNATGTQQPATAPRSLIVRASVVVAMVLAMLGLAAAPAQAATPTITGPGTALVQQWVTVQSSGWDPGTTVTLGDVNGTQYGTQQLTNSQGQASFTFQTPSGPQTLNLQAASTLLGGPTSNVLTMRITTVSTTTAISAPNTAQVGVPTLVTVTVQSQSPSAYAPTGQVVVRDATGATVITMGLTASSTANGQSFAYWRWTPPSVGTFTFQATYNGDAVAAGSTSPVDVVAATTSGNTISLNAPKTMTVGVPVQLTATVVPASLQGSAGFTVNGQPISASVPFVNGVATFVWTPTAAGTVTLGVNYMANGGRSGSTSERVTIAAGPAATDVITLVEPGFGNWAPNGTYTRGNGSTITFQASTLSGAGVTLNENGPCTVSGLTLSVNSGSGQCTLIATSPGGPGYAPVTQRYTVALVPGQQTAALAAPPSGRFNEGRTLRLQNPAQGVTNADQNVTWRVTSGGNRCKLRYPSSGAVNLQLRRPGTCTVVARAAAVPGQWQAFRMELTYRVR